MKYLVFLLALLSFSCTQQKEKTIITSSSDYLHYLNTDEPNSVFTSNESEIDFWQQKLDENPNGFLYHQKIGAALANEFEITGEIELINQSNYHFKEAIQRTTGKSKAATLLNLSSNSIKLHKFRDALKYAYQAEQYTNEFYASRLMQYDALMEIGAYEQARKVLKSTQRNGDFNYLVRYAKYQDYIGQLDSAIYLMETALDAVDNDQSKKLWAMASLGDYYGHSGQIQKSYNTFLEVLQEDNSYAHALKGIAWIAYSNDGDTESALRILEHLDQQKVLPDTKLAMAEIYEYMGDTDMQMTMMENFIKEASNEKYADMYNNYLIDYFVEKDIAKAAVLANTEIKNRPTPQSYTAKAWVQYYKEDFTGAMQTINEEVIDKTYEPALLYKAAKIAVAAGEDRLATTLLKECKEASFELGPVVSKSINNFN